MASMFRNCLRAMLPVLFVALVAPVHAGKLEKAFKAIEVHDYFKARTLLRKQIKKHPAAAWYGMSVISGRANNPFFNVDSAYQFILKADLAFSEAEDRERIAIGKVGVGHTAIQAQRTHVYDLAWEVTKGQNTITAYRNYLERFPSGSRGEEARAVMHHLAFQEAREVNTSAAYQKFISEYRDAKEVYEARTRMQECVYREGIGQKDIPSYVAFIKAHPDSPYARQAEDEIFKLSTPTTTIPEYKKFIQQFPENHRVPDAWRSIYEMYTRDLSPNTITRFIAEYPEYPFMDELVEDYATANLELLPFRREGKWGFMDTTGTERIKAEYEWVEPFKAGQALVSRDSLVGTVIAWESPSSRSSMMK